MYFLFSLIPATIWVIVGYFVLFASDKAQGRIGLFGRILAVWVFVIAALFPLVGAYATIAGFPGPYMMERMHPQNG